MNHTQAVITSVQGEATSLPALVSRLEFPSWPQKRAHCSLSLHGSSLHTCCPNRAAGVWTGCDSAPDCPH